MLSRKMAIPQTAAPPSQLQCFVLLGLRLAIGWHLLYEGLAKLLMPDWTSAGYLEKSSWALGGVFRWLASDPRLISLVDALCIGGLTLIGLCLFLGLMTRVAAIAGACLVGLFYLAHPPLIQSAPTVPVEGHYLLVNKNLVEVLALVVLAVFPTGQWLGLDRLWAARRGRKATVPEAERAGSNLSPGWGTPRRDLVWSLATTPFLGALVYGASRKHRWEEVHAITGASVKVSSTRLKDLKGELPCGTIGGLRISRLIIGGNLIGGWAHARDLHYVSSLFKAYNTDRKVFETLELAEQAGINTMNISVSQFPLINRYKAVTGSRLQTISQVHPTRENLFGDIDRAIDAGADLIQIQGNCCDWRVRAGEIDVLVQAIDYIRRQGYPAGLGAHSIQALKACDDAGIRPDFYMKTLHHDRYWSAHPRENRIPFSVDGEKSPDHNHFHDNMFCLFPEETIAFMQERDIPFIAFKVLAGGAIPPAEGFRYAFEGGADFICVGMFDYQVVDDVNLVLDILANPPSRLRPWCA